MKSRVCAITITYHPDHELLERQMRGLYGDCDHVLVDNGSVPGTQKNLAEASRRYNCHLLTSGCNESLAASQLSRLGTSALGCDFNRSMQHLISHYREEDVEYEVPDEDLLHRN